MSVPNDSMILLSYVNTQLRDNYPSLEEMCKSINEDAEKIKAKLAAVGYEYNSELNRFV